MSGQRDGSKTCPLAPTTKLFADGLGAASCRRRDALGVDAAVQGPRAGTVVIAKGLRHATGLGDAHLALALTDGCRTPANNPLASRSADRMPR
jgi:hypothetical protein